MKKKTSRKKKATHPPARKKSDREWLGGIGDVCAAINLRERRVFQLIKDEGLPRMGPGQYNITAVCKWYIQYLTQKIYRRDHPPMGSRDAGSQARGTIIAIELEMKRILLAERREALISSDRVAKDIRLIVREIRRRVLALPPVIAAAVVAETDIAVAQVRVDSILKDCLARLSEYDPEAVQPASPSRSTLRTQ